MAFKKATRVQAKLRLALIGPAGSGKTVTGLKLATYLFPGGKIALLDSERGSASKYAPAPGKSANPDNDTFDFDVEEPEDFSPATYLRFLADCVRGGYDVAVIDSLSHAWAGTGGILDQLDKKGGGRGNFDSWRTLTPQHNDLVDALIRTPIHIIATMRTKTEYVVEKDEKTGKNTPRKVGLAPVQRDGLEYEFDVVMDIDGDHIATVSKTRCSAISGKAFRKPGADLAGILSAWLSDGSPAPAAPAPTAAPSIDWQSKIDEASRQAKPFGALLNVAEEIAAASLNGSRDAVVDSLAKAFENRMREITDIATLSGATDAVTERLPKSLAPALKPWITRVFEERRAELSTPAVGK